LKKLAVLAVAVLVLALAATVAQARTVVGAHVNPDAAAVRAYWTPERMRTAVPADIVRGGGPRQPNAKPGGGGGGGSTSGTATLVTWPTSIDLTYTNGKVYFSDGAARYVCSGTAVNSVNGSVVWTAGHCVNDGGQNRFYSNWTFVPAYNSGVPYQTFVADHLYTSAEWAQSREFGKDYGAAVVGTQGGKTLEQTIGFGRDLAFAPNYTTGRPLDAYGYPAAGKFNGERLYHCNSSLQRVDTASPDTMGIPCTMNGGSSGGAWLDPANGGRQVSNNSYGYSSLKNVMFGPVFGPVAEDLLHAAEGTQAPASVVGGIG
jgi:hypothetical protein